MFKRYYFLKAEAPLLPSVFGHVFLSVDEKRKALMFGALVSEERCVGEGKTFLVVVRVI